MKVILLEEVKGKGGEGDVVEVAQGFAVNYLLPRNMAVKATPGNLKQLEARRHNIEKRELARTTDAGVIRDALEGKQVIVPAKVGDEGQLFGSVTTTAIAEAIAEQIGANVDRKKIDIGKAIKTAGDHEVSVSIYRDIRATLTVTVVDADAKPAEAAKEAVVEEVVEVIEAETAEGAEEVVVVEEEVELPTEDAE